MRTHLRRPLVSVSLAAILLLASCFTNNPYRPEETIRNTYYDTFSQEPKHLDPASAYYISQFGYICQIYEPVVQYHFLKRPFVLEPLTAERVPEPQFFDSDGKRLADDAPDQAVARAIYEIRLKPDIRYQNHACFAKNADGTYVWHLLPGQSFPRKIAHPDDLMGAGTREVRAEDYVYQIKRLAHPSLPCPIASVMAKYIEGFADYQRTLADELARIRAERREAAGVFYNQEADERANPIFLDLRTFDLPGVQVVDDRTYRITLTRRYPQFIYWLAMSFFVPVPWEADRFYTQAAAIEQDISLNRFPVGSGPYMLAVNQPNYRMVLRRNPNYHEDRYPTEGGPGDEAGGLLVDRGKQLPFTDEAVYVLEKESIPRWSKFLQGYYDTSGIESDVFSQAVQIRAEGAAGLTDAMKDQGIRIETAVSMSTDYYMFNMLDDVVGGYDEKRSKLRQALSIVVSQEEYIEIFRNGRGVPAQGPIPPGIFGYQEGREGINPYVYDWDETAKAGRRKSIDEARRLLAEAGYPDGRNAQGDPLVLFYDTTATVAGGKAYLDWLRKQFDRIGVQLQIRSTDSNRLQEKLLKGNFQISGGGWVADYPDPENFLFLLYGPNSKVKSQGENSANYNNPRFNDLFRKMENMPNSPEREELIREMLAILRPAINANGLSAMSDPNDSSRS